MDLKYPSHDSIGNDKVGDSYPGEISPHETEDYNQEHKAEINLPEAGEDGFSGRQNIENRTLGESSKRSTILVNGTPKQPFKHHKATIMVAGRARNGKSTALNNVFGLKSTAIASANSVTQVVSDFEATRKVPFLSEEKEEEVTLRVIDTPGLGAADIPKEKILKDMKDIIQGEDYILMYCFCVAPNQNVAEIDVAIVKNLQQSLGKEVWKKCVLLFTFSDWARLSFKNSEDYIKYIKGHAIEFQKILTLIDPANSVAVKTIFEYKSSEELEQDKNPSEIIAIPVSIDPSNCESILPGMIRENQDWTEIVFGELMKKSPEEKQTPYVLFRYPNIFLGTSTGSGGALVGAFIGAVVGAVAGPLGMTGGAYVGGAMGAAMGATAGTVTGYATGKALASRKSE